LLRSTLYTEGVFTKVGDLSSLAGVGIKLEDHEAYHAQFEDAAYSDATGNLSAYAHPHSTFNEPVFSKLHDRTSEIVGLIMGVLPWDRYLVNLLPVGVEGIHCVLKNSCGQSFTYALSGNNVSNPEWNALRCIDTTARHPLLSNDQLTRFLCRPFTSERATSMNQSTVIWLSRFLSPTICMTRRLRTQKDTALIL
jgi:hypothetical protein